MVTIGGRISRKALACKLFYGKLWRNCYLCFIRPKLRGFAVILHLAPERAVVYRHVAVGDEQGRRFIFSCCEVGADEFLFIRLHGVDAGEGAIEPSDGDSSAFQVNVCAVEHSYLGGAQPMPIGSKENSAIAL